MPRSVALPGYQGGSESRAYLSRLDRSHADREQALAQPALSREGTGRRVLTAISLPSLHLLHHA